MLKRTQKKLARLNARVPEGLRDRVAGNALRTQCSESDVIRAHIEAAYIHGDEVADGIVRSRHPLRESDQA